jgi:DNA-binding response OmpR family regulator
MNDLQNGTSSAPCVMIVDDEECIRETMGELLSSEGIDVVTADGSDECMRLLLEGFRGVILMDVMMPGKNGWQTIRAIESAGLLKGNIISMLTAMDVPDEQMEGLQEIVVDYITKPFEPAELITSVRKYLGYLELARVAAE